MSMTAVIVWLYLVTYRWKCWLTKECLKRIKSNMFQLCVRSCMYIHIYIIYIYVCVCAPIGANHENNRNDTDWICWQKCRTILLWHYYGKYWKITMFDLTHQQRFDACHGNFRCQKHCVITGTHRGGLLNIFVHFWQCPGAMLYPLVICYIAIENVPFIVDLPMKNGDFP